MNSLSLPGPDGRVDKMPMQEHGIEPAFSMSDLSSGGLTILVYSSEALPFSVFIMHSAGALAARLAVMEKGSGDEIAVDDKFYGDGLSCADAIMKSLKRTEYLDEIAGLACLMMSGGMFDEDEMLARFGWK